MMSTSSRRPPYHSQSSSQSRLDPPLSSPAPSTSQFSGISGYAAESRAGGSGGGGGSGPGGGAAGGGSGESRRVAREHWDALRGFLAEFLKKGEYIVIYGDVKGPLRSAQTVGRAQGRESGRARPPSCSRPFVLVRGRRTHIVHTLTCSCAWWSDTMQSLPTLVRTRVRS